MQLGEVQLQHARQLYQPAQETVQCRVLTHEFQLQRRHGIKILALDPAGRDAQETDPVFAGGPVQGLGKARDVRLQRQAPGPLPVLGEILFRIAQLPPQPGTLLLQSRDFLFPQCQPCVF